MKRIAISVIAATLVTYGSGAVAQIASDVGENSLSTDTLVSQSTPVKPITRRAMFDGGSFFDSIGLDIMSHDPTSQGLRSKDVYSKQGISGDGESVPTEDSGK